MDANHPKPGGLWSRLFGMEPETAPAPAATPQLPSTADYPALAPVEEMHPDQVLEDDDVLSALDAGYSDAPPTLEIRKSELEPPSVAEEPSPIALPPCASCGATRKLDAEFCHDCGYMFPATNETPAAPTLSPAEFIAPLAAVAHAPSHPLRLNDRYLVGQLVREKAGVTRHRALDARPFSAGTG